MIYEKINLLHTYIIGSWCLREVSEEWMAFGRHVHLNRDPDGELKYKCFSE